MLDSQKLVGSESVEPLRWLGLSLRLVCSQTLLKLTNDIMETIDSGKITIFNCSRHVCGIRYS